MGGGGVQVDKWVGHTGLIAGGCDRDVRACGIGLGWGVRGERCADLNRGGRESGVLFITKLGNGSKMTII